MKIMNVAASILLVATFTVLPGGGALLNATAHAQSQDEADTLVGVWEGDGPSDARAQQHTVLELHADHTYTKTLRASVDGVAYGGTHSGTWTSRGNIVNLSGDGDYPPYSQDLRLMHKVNK